MADNAATRAPALSQVRDDAAEFAIEPDEPVAPVETAKPDADAADAQPCEATRGAAGDDDEAGGEVEVATPARKPIPPQRAALVVGLVVLLALAGLGGWLGFRAHQSRQASQQRELFLQVARQGAINLTTIDYTKADTDIQRILNSATGSFYDDFSKRSQPFVDVIKQVQAKSVGTITAAGLESDSADQAQALVAVTVKTTSAGATEQPGRAWRMRISVQKVGNQAKVSNVGFVP